MRHHADRVRTKALLREFLDRLQRCHTLARVHVLVWPWPGALGAPLKLIGFVIYQDHRHDVCF